MIIMSEFNATCLRFLGAIWPCLESESSQVKCEYARLVRALIAAEAEGA